MSKAFTKEDVDPPERTGRARSASGLPPGAANYITAAGAAWLRRELTTLRQNTAHTVNAARIDEIDRILKSVTVVDPGVTDEPVVGFGAKVTLSTAKGETKSYRILGLDELDRDSDAVSWISPIGRTLLAAKLNEQVTLPDLGPAKILKVEYPE